ncbi:hypothetical protein EDD85DRAFT_955825 [Armillaria nabsnona]|nr:hypothetical protein EDD85DRAFT_955825 [Armillaria nabsnona]
MKKWITLKLYRADKSNVYKDLSISHSRQVKLGHAQTVFQIAGAPSGHRTKCTLIRVGDDLVPQEFYVDSGYFNPEPTPTIQRKVPAKRYTNSDRPMLEWMGSSDKLGFHEEFLLELLRWKDVTAAHEGSCLPLHVIQKWEGEQFIKMAMWDLGLRVQLGHFDGTSCINPERAGRTFVVMDTDGLHKVEFGWYPASLRQPQTCATLSLLDQFHSLTLASKISGYDFYKSLAHMTDAMGLNVPKTKYKCLLHVVRQFRHLKMMMCAGRGQEEDGVKTTVEGGLALHCPACPILEVNLPASWMGCMPEKRYIYWGLFALDANFRLKNLHRSNSDVDPGLHTGLTYMVKYAPYLVHVKKFASQKDISTCSGFKTLVHAETKGEAGLRASGVGMCICACHKMVCATGVADLQKGERYTNMDYILLSVVSQLQLDNLFISYDIACQWCINFNTQMTTDLPTHL